MLFVPAIFPCPVSDVDASVEYSRALALVEQRFKAGGRIRIVSARGIFNHPLHSSFGRLAPRVSSSRSGQSRGNRSAVDNVVPVSPPLASWSSEGVKHPGGEEATKLLYDTVIQV